jgi:hypothetical protein
VRKDRDDVAKGRHEAALKPIDEAGSLIIALVVDAMLQRRVERWEAVVVEEVLRIFVDLRRFQAYRRDPLLF